MRCRTRNGAAALPSSTPISRSSTPDRHTSATVLRRGHCRFCLSVLTTLLAALVAVLMGAACSSPVPEASTQPGAGADWLEISDGTSIHDYAHLPWAQRSSELELPDEVIIEERLGDSRYAFGEAPPTLALDQLGRFFVYDAGNYRVAVFGADGEFLFQFGSRGQGPGEFNSDARGPIGFLGDRLFVSLGYRRLGFWTPEGEFLDGSEHRINDARFVPLDDGTVISGGILREISERQALNTVGRFEIGANGLEPRRVYARVPAGSQPSFAGESDGRAYLSTIEQGATQLVAFAADGAIRWVARFRWPAEETQMPSDLLLDGRGRIYVVPRLNRVQAPPPDARRWVEVLGPAGAFLGAATIRDVPLGIIWQQARGDYIYGVQADPDTDEWQVARYHLALPFE